jgi:predicted nucleic acid-binding protein
VIIDASVWVAIFRDNDVHHVVSVRFLETAIAAGQDLHLPNLALAEIAGVIARQTGNSRLASRTLNAVLALPRLQRHDFTDPMADRAAALAASCKLRGADAVYVSLAEALKRPLISLDNEILERSTRVVKARTPADWLNSP